MMTVDGSPFVTFEKFGTKSWRFSPFSYVILSEMGKARGPPIADELFVRDFDSPLTLNLTLSPKTAMMR